MSPLPGERGKHNRDMVLPQRGVRVSTSHGITYKSQHHGRNVYRRRGGGGGEGEGETIVFMYGHTYCMKDTTI